MIGWLRNLLYFLGVGVVVAFIYEMWIKDLRVLESVREVPYLSQLADYLSPDRQTNYPATSFGEGPIQMDETSGASRFTTGFEELKQSFEPLTTYSSDFAWRRHARSIGSLQVQWNDADGDVGRCTAFFITPTHVMSAQHCIQPDPDKGRHSVHKILLVLNYLESGSQTYAFSVAREPVERSPAILAGTDGLDYAVFHVDLSEEVKGQTLPEELQPVPLSIVAEAPDIADGPQRLYILHHPAQHPLLLTSYDCRTALRRDPVLQHTFAHVCDTLPGSSGAPIFALPGDYVIGMHFKGANDFVNDASPNRSQLISAIADHSAVGSGFIARAIDPRPFSQAQLAQLERNLRASRTATNAQHHALAALFAYKGFPPDWDKSEKLPAESAELQTALASALARKTERLFITGRSPTYSPDGKQLLVVEDDGIHVWTEVAGERIRSIIQYEDQFFHSAAFSSDGERILATTFDSALIYRSTGGHDLLNQIRIPEGGFRRRFSPMGSHLLAGSNDDDLLRVYHVSQNVRPGEQPFAVLEGVTDNYRSAAFSSDGANVIVETEERAVFAFDALAGGAPMYQLQPPDGEVVGVNYAAQSDTVLLISEGSNDNSTKIDLYDAFTGNRLHTGQIAEEIDTSEISADGERIVLTTTDNELLILDRNSLSTPLVRLPISERQNDYYYIYDVSKDGRTVGLLDPVSPRGLVFDTVDSDAPPQIVQFDAPQNEIIRLFLDADRVLLSKGLEAHSEFELSTHRHAVAPLQPVRGQGYSNASYTDKYLLLAGFAAPPTLFDASGKPVPGALPDAGIFSTGHFSKSGNRLVLLDYASLLESNRTETLIHVTDLPIGTGSSSSFSIPRVASTAVVSPNGTHMLVVDRDHSVVEVALDGTAEAKPIPTPDQSGIHLIDYSPTGEQAFVLTHDGQLDRFDMTSERGTPLVSPVQGGRVRSAVYAPTGGSLLIVLDRVLNLISEDGTVQTLSVSAGASDHGFADATFSPDGSMVIGRTWSGKAFLFTSVNGRFDPIATPIGPGNANRAIFAPASDRILFNARGRVTVIDAHDPNKAPITIPFLNSVGNASFSSDGKLFLASRSNAGGIYVKSTAHPLAPAVALIDQAAAAAFWSPDGSHVLYTASDGLLYRLAVPEPMTDLLRQAETELMSSGRLSGEGKSILSNTECTNYSVVCLQ